MQQTQKTSIGEEASNAFEGNYKESHREAKGGSDENTHDLDIASMRGEF